MKTAGSESALTLCPALLTQDHPNLGGVRLWNERPIAPVTSTLTYRISTAIALPKWTKFPSGEEIEPLSKDPRKAFYVDSLCNSRANFVPMQ
jgi:hypothetical protein